MDIAAALFVFFIISLGLYNSYRKYKNGMLPINFLRVHVLIGFIVVIIAYFLLFK